MFKLLTTTACCLLMTAAGLAAPPDPAVVPADAKWVVHFDYEALSDTQLMQKIRQARPEMIAGARQWLKSRYGIDPREDFKGVTFYSDSYESHTGAAVLFADFDRKQAVSLLKSQPGVKTTEWKNHTLYTWDAHRAERSRRGQSTDKKKERDEQESGQKDGKDAEGRERAHDSHSHEKPQMITALLLDGKAVFAADPDRVKSAAKLLMSERPAGRKSPLFQNVPEDAVLYGAAVDLEKIAKHEGIFPILRQHERIRYAIGGSGGRMYEEATFVAQDEKVAEQMKTAIEGLVALGEVWTAGTEELARLWKDVELSRNGSTVEARWHGRTEDVLAALEELQRRMQQMRQVRQN